MNKKVFAKVMIVLLIALSLIGCGEKTIKVYSSASEMKGKKYTDVISKLTEQGFTNIEEVEIDDLMVSSDSSINTIESILIDGNDSFDVDTKFPISAKIVISFHNVKKIVIGNRPSDFRGKNYEDVINQLKNKGFINIKENTKATNNKEEDGKVSDVYINGQQSYTENNEFDIGSTIDIHYYQYEENDCPFQYCAMQTYGTGAFSFSIYYLLDTNNGFAYSWQDGQNSADKGKLSGNATDGFTIKYSSDWIEKLYFFGGYGEGVMLVDSNGDTYDNLISVNPKNIWKNNISIIEKAHIES